MARMKKPKVGRPPLGAAARSRKVTVKLTPAEFDAIERAVADVKPHEEGLPTVAAWIRHYALAPLRRE